MKLMGKTKYINSMGELHRKDSSLCFRREGGKSIYIPIENVSEIYCFNEVTINTKLLDFLASKEVIVHLYNYYGNYVGTFYPREHLISGRLLIAQVNGYYSDALFLAKKIVSAVADNVAEVLYHYYKHGISDVKPFIDELRTVYLQKISACDNHQELMSIEGSIWANFYASFRFFLREDFRLNKRVRRPPDNPINAMISFGNMWLYTKCISIIYRTQLNQSISFLHTPSEGRFSLSLDLSEMFKPIVVFRSIFELVNNRRIRVEEHFVRDVNYCVLNEEGRNIFVESLERHVDTVFDHPRLKRKTSFRNAIRLDCYKLIKFLLENKDFEFFRLKDKV